MNTFQKKFLALSIMSVMSTPVFASVDVVVTGTITPAACTPTLSGGGVADYGNIEASSLSASQYTLLAQKNVNLSITCQAATKVAINATNGRAGSLAGATEAGPNNTADSPVAGLNGWANNPNPVVGLGLAPNGAKIGGYALAIANSVADGTPVGLTSRKDGAEWANPAASTSVNGKNMYNNDSHLDMTWASDTDNVNPIQFTTLSADFHVQAYINKSSELDLSQEIQLDGLTTINLVYL